MKHSIYIIYIQVHGSSLEFPAMGADLHSCILQCL